jgi:hypothetical protein
MSHRLSRTLTITAVMLLIICKNCRPDIRSMYPHGPVVELTSCPSARITVTVAPLRNSGPKIARSSRGKMVNTMKEGKASRKIQLVMRT